MRLELRFTVIITCFNAMIYLINGANETKLAAVIFPDGSTVEIVGSWRIFAIQRSSDSHGKVSCFVAKLFNISGGVLVEEFLYKLDGNPVDVKVIIELIEKPVLGLSYYLFNADGSKGEKICEAGRGKFASHRHLFKFAARPTCNIARGLNLKAICTIKDGNLTEDDEEDMSKLCPPEDFEYISQENC